MNYIEEEKLKNILIEKNYIPDESIFLSKPKNISITEYIIQNDILTYNSLKEILNIVFDIKEHKLSISEIDRNIIKLFDYNFINKYNIFPFKVKENKIYVVMADPFNTVVCDNIKLISKKNVKVYFGNYYDIKFFINYFYKNDNIINIEQNFKNKKVTDIFNYDNKNLEEAPIIKMVEYIIDSAVFLKASDIHIEPLKEKIRIRFRIDGYLQEQEYIDKKLFLNIVSRFKIISGMDITITRIPQDGHFKDYRNNIQIDYRVSTIPTIYGEKIVIRLLYNNITYNYLSNSLGFFEEDIKILKDLLKNTYGIILVTGTTGSGKTTTLSSFLSYLNKKDVNIITIEDPVENYIEGINHININQKINLDFHNILKSILRQDPDIIMIGEIRDEKTAKMAVRASITGHLVLTTLHTNNALSAITRLIDMGVEKYLVTSAIKGIISQSLVRKLCPNCKKKVKITKEQAKILEIKEDIFVYEAVGCKECFYIGYKGRLPIYEIIIINNKIKDIITSKKHITEIIEIIPKENISKLKDNILKNIINGNTSINEIYKVLYSTF